MYHTIEHQESYTGATERLAQPLAPTRPVEPLLYRWAALAICTILLLLWLARLPAPQPVVVLEPAQGGYSSQVNVLSNNCVGWCPR